MYWVSEGDVNISSMSTWKNLRCAVLSEYVCKYSMCKHSWKKYSLLYVHINSYPLFQLIFHTESTLTVKGILAYAFTRTQTQCYSSSARTHIATVAAAEDSHLPEEAWMLKSCLELACRLPPLRVPQRGNDPPFSPHSQVPALSPLPLLQHFPLLQRPHHTASRPRLGPTSTCGRLKCRSRSAEWRVLAGYILWVWDTWPCVLESGNSVFG